MPVAGNRRRGLRLAWPRLFLAAVLLPSPLSAGELEVVPAWSGRFVPGEPTEVRLDFVSPRGGFTLVRAEGKGGAVEQRLSAEAGRRMGVSLPAYPGPDGQLEISVRLPNGETVAQTLALQPRPARLAVAVTTQDGDGDASSEDTIHVGIGDLPRLPAGYRPLSSLTLAPGALAALHEDRIPALADFLARCGVLTVPDADPALLDQLRSTAGCAGRFVATTRGIGTAPTLPEQGPLAVNLAVAAGPDVRQLALLLLPYPLLLAGLALLRRSGPWLLVLPPAAALAYAGVLPQAAPPAVATTWAETFEGDAHYRFVTLLRSGGSDTARLRLPKAAGLVVPVDRPHRLRMDPDGGLMLEPPPALLTYREYRLEGVGHVPFHLRISTRANGTRIDNTGPEASPPGWLLRQGASFPIPPLTPGESRTVYADATAGDPPLSLPVPIGRAPSVLLPLPQALPAAADPQIRSRGWLWVRPIDELPS